ncbi:5-carboxymethyl-2-hydroxymuconate Delta-isomerase [Iodobacter fluviatilis]|jgi:5-carboxymethyl-2-hydroxymuconate isomerase|uniref:5-carboxymethyl-2-hydroxymuconate isomerase n=1 Tax=Iodobacter fluviatilis TaxID=537 RepID=A0A7G3G9F4_9NEIS|nr:5-carboxymethyl-2-hydroxymuconate Delta-isomerase [Iodobacter fluviatilis]QBC43846.1 5-carboxymethyl-2-hydroxymuconate isomerase [Iodobacter fluviatilis]
MPHLNLEYSKNLSGFNPRLALQQLNNALIESGHYIESDIQSRAMGFDDFLIGNKDEGRAFIHIKLRLLSGRSAEIKKALSDALIQAIEIDNPQALNISIRAEIIDIDRGSYGSKNMVG